MVYICDLKKPVMISKFPSSTLDYSMARDDAFLEICHILNIGRELQSSTKVLARLPTFAVSVMEIY